MTPPAQRTHREVVSFVRRSMRLNPSQERAWAGRERYLLEVPRAQTTTSVAADAAVDWPAIFGRRAELVVEIGSGGGEALAAMAGAAPDRDHIAFEVFRPALASTMIKLRHAGLENVRLVDANGVDGLTRLFGAASVSEVWTFFPDPWHKSRHHKRRLISAAFADLVAERLRPGGLWRIATDWDAYAEHCRQLLDRHPLFFNVYADSGGLAPRPEARPITKYERRGLAAGRAITDLVYRRQ